jgi:Flp pilus assembly protein TadG
MPILFHRRRRFSARLDQGRNSFQGERGQALVEFAFTLPILLTFVFGLMEICLMFYTREYISELAREGTRYAIVHGSTCATSPNGASCTASPTASDATSVAKYVQERGWPNLGGGKLNPVVTYLNGDEAPGHQVRVSITYQFPYSIPFIKESELSMTSSSTMTIIQ